MMLDLGPNGLWDFKKDANLDDYIQFRFTINSIAMNNEDIGGWTDLIRDVDQKWIAQNDIERIKLTQSYSQESLELLLQSKSFEFFDSVSFEQKAPLPGETGWQDYLMQPYFREPFFEKMSLEEIKIYLDKNMPKKATRGVYNPWLNDTLNHKSYEYIISELTNAGIKVLLLAVPHHPLVHTYLSEGQLDNFNSTFDRFSSYEGVEGVNLFWEEWHSSMFRDSNHLGVNGREYLCERLTPIIDGVLEDRNISEIDPEIGTINLSGYLEESCHGNDVTNQIKFRYNFIQAESYSDCSWGEGIGFQDKWEFMSSSEYRGSGYLQALPEDVSQYKGGVLGSRLDYNLEFNEEGTYYVWMNMKGNSYGNDSISVGWKYAESEYISVKKYDSYGWSSKGQWEWEPEFTKDPMEINASKNDDVTLSIWMTEDGVMIDEILITSNPNLTPKTIDPHALENKPLKCEGTGKMWQAPLIGELQIEAEDFTDCSFGEGKSENHQWIVVSDANSSSGLFLNAIPDNLVHMRDEKGPGLHYAVNLQNNQTYYVWISMRGNSYGNDTIGLSYTILDNESNVTIISSFAWNSFGQWEWEPQTSQEPLVVSGENGDIVTINVWMREDGVEFDRLIVTNDPDFNPNAEA